MTDLAVKDANSVIQTLAANLALGRQLAAASKSWAMSTEDRALFDQLLTIWSTPASSIPHFALETTQDFQVALFNDLDATNGGAGVDIVAAGLSTETTRVHGISIEASAACVISLYRNGVGGQLLRKFRFASAGVINLEIRGRPRWMTGLGEKLTILSSNSSPFTGQVEYVRSVP